MGFDLTGSEALIMLLLTLVPVLIGLFLAYFVIRLAVRHALTDVMRDGRAIDVDRSPRP